MAVERVSGGSSLIDVLDRVLDKGVLLAPGYAPPWSVLT